MTNEENLAQQLGEAISILTEVEAYLRRLSPVPSTVHLANKIDSFLLKPDAYGSRTQAVKQAYATRHVQIGSVFTAVGGELFKLEVESDGTATAYAGNPSQRLGVNAQDLTRLGLMLQREQGLTIKLTAAKAFREGDLGKY